jgi:hypothetical protein
MPAGLPLDGGDLAYADALLAFADAGAGEESLAADGDVPIELDLSVVPLGLDMAPLLVRGGRVSQKWGKCMRGMAVSRRHSA